MSTDLETRTCLPDPLRILLAEHPRAGWAADPNFRGLVEFWLDRHLMFRRLMAAMQSDTEALVDRRLDPEVFAPRLARDGSMFVGELHGHHHIEDAHYFPVLVRTEPRLARGFEILDRDHHALDSHLAAFTEAANAALRPENPREHGAQFLSHLNGLAKLLDRHLTDEEELIVPIILKHGQAGLG